MTCMASNVVFGMYSGLALLMDVYYPEHANGYGILCIPGSGWHAPQTYDARPLKARPQTAETYIQPLRAAGYTVFAVNHRAAPRFRWPAALEDVQRAVRYIRHHASHYRIRPERLGAVGGSSGGHLVSLLGVVDGRGEAEDPDPVNRESAKVQCVVAQAAPSDFLRVPLEGATSAIVAFLGMTLVVGRQPPLPPTSLEYRTYQAASPVYAVSTESAPFLLIHGDADIVMPFKHAELMAHALHQAGVAVELLRVEGGAHGPDFPGARNPPDYVGAMVRWFDQYLP